MTGKRQVDKFMRYLRYEKRYSPHTMVAYQGDLDQFYIYIKEQYQISDWIDVRMVHIRSWVYSLAEQKMEKRSINRKISSLRSFFQFLKKECVISFNPVKAIQPLKTARVLPEVVPEAVLKSFFKFSGRESWKDNRDRMLIMLLYETGMRRSELKELTWKDVDLDKGYIRVMGKGQKQRQVPIRAEMTDVLSEYKSQTTSEFKLLRNHVMITDRGEKVYSKWIYNKVRSILGCWANNEHLSPHVLRHSIATHLLNAGADIQVIREFLGHTTLAATEIYTHNSIGKLKKTYKSALPDLDAQNTIQ